MTEATKTLEPDPVFVDHTGRRRRLARNVGIAVGCVLVAYLAVVAFGLVSGSGAPLTPWPDAGPSRGGALPPQRGSAGHGTARPRATQRTAVPTPSTPTGRETRAPRSRTPSRTAPGTAAPTTARAGRGHAYGVTKSSHPKKP